MPTSVRGSEGGLARDLRDPGRGPVRRQHGFTLIELMIVVAITVVAAGVVVLALRDGEAARLEEEGARLAALLEMGRAEARVAGSSVRWVPQQVQGNETGAERHFRFVGLLDEKALPQRWIDAGTRAEIVGAGFVLLGPEAILPAQRIVLRLGTHRLDVASNGLVAFAPSPVSTGNPP
jgi:general secretion pathway protein H